jgi:2-polyprenyl-3-methyl-5-hydroxy-6-metoxy-1,4-benzoquinol methylase
MICRSENNYPLCKKCAKKPFWVERVRQVLASIGELKLLGKMYNQKYSEIKNLNTSSFWNKKLFHKRGLDEQDGMTSDRVRVAFNFLPRNAKKILDIGAGSGFIEELLCQTNVKIYGNDISEVAVKNLLERFGGKFRRESIYRMRYPKGAFDVIFALEVLEHIPPSRIFKILKKIKEILRKNGFLIISVPTNEGLDKMKINPSGHVRTYTENLIRSELKIAGFKVIKLKTLFAFKSFYSFKKISSKFLRNRWKPNDIVILAKAQ